MQGQKLTKTSQNNNEQYCWNTWKNITDFQTKGNFKKWDFFLRGKLPYYLVRKSMYIVWGLAWVVSQLAWFNFIMAEDVDNSGSHAHKEEFLKQSTIKISWYASLSLHILGFLMRLLSSDRDVQDVNCTNVMKTLEKHKGCAMNTFWVHSKVMQVSWTCCIWFFQYNLYFLYVIENIINTVFCENPQCKWFDLNIRMKGNFFDNLSNEIYTKVSIIS